MPRKKSTPQTDGTVKIITANPVKASSLKTGMSIVLYGEPCKVGRLSDVKKLTGVVIVTIKDFPGRDDFTTVLRRDELIPTKIVSRTNVETYEILPTKEEQPEEEIDPEDFFGTPTEPTRKTRKPPVVSPTGKRPLTAESALKTRKELETGTGVFPEPVSHGEKLNRFSEILVRELKSCYTPSSCPG